jgi:hypothetical protein
LAPELQALGLELVAQELAALAQEALELVACSEEEVPVEALAVVVEAVAVAVAATLEEAVEEAHSLSEPALLAQEVNLVVTSHLHSPWLLQLQFVIPA